MSSRGTHSAVVWCRGLHGLRGTARDLVRVTTDAPRRGHSELNLRNIYVTRHYWEQHRSVRGGLARGPGPFVLPFWYRRGRVEKRRRR